MTEYLNVYDDDYKWSGREERSVVHKNGKWHYVFHCWVYDQKKHQIILQRRAETKMLFPKSYDASCAGHYSSEEEHDSTRELVEELGIEASYDQLVYLMDFHEVFKVGSICDREIAKVHLLITDTFCPEPSTPEEIDSIVACDYEAFRDLIEERKSEVEIELLYGINTDHTFTRDQLVRRKVPYYQDVFRHIHEHVTKL